MSNRADLSGCPTLLPSILIMWCTPMNACYGNSSSRLLEIQKLCIMIRSPRLRSSCMTLTKVVNLMTYYLGHRFLCTKG